MNRFNLEIIKNPELFNFAEMLWATYGKDVIAMREEWSCFLDALCTEGSISEECYYNSDGFEELSRIWGL